MHSSPVCLDAPMLAATHAVAGALAPLCRAGDVVVLAGDMGAGKTAFAQGFGRALGVTEPITSPTFTLVQTYDVPRPPHGRQLQLHHADVYRLDQLAEVADLAVGELAEFDGIVLVEWGDVVAGALGEHLLVELEPFDAAVELGDSASGDDASVGDEPPSGRRISVSATGMSWASRWEPITRALGRLGLEAAPC